MVGKLAFALVASVALVITFIAGSAVATCPRNVSDCGIALPGDGSDSSTGPADKIVRYLTAGGYELTATLSGGGSAGSAKAGATAQLHIIVSNVSATGPAHFVIDLSGALGVSSNDGADVYEFDYDPASGFEPEGTFDFEVTGRAGSQLTIPILFLVKDEATGDRDAAASVMPMPIQGKAPTSFSWLMPGVIGLMLGLALASVLRRKK